MNKLKKETKAILILRGYNVKEDNESEMVYSKEGGFKDISISKNEFNVDNILDSLVYNIKLSYSELKKESNDTIKEFIMSSIRNVEGLINIRLNDFNVLQMFDIFKVIYEGLYIPISMNYLLDNISRKRNIELLDTIIRNSQNDFERRFRLSNAIIQNEEIAKDLSFIVKEYITDNNVAFDNELLFDILFIDVLVETVMHNKLYILF